MCSIIMPLLNVHAKTCAIFLIATLLMMSSFQANFQNLLQKSDLKSNDIQKAFAQAPPPIDTSLIRNYINFLVMLKSH